MAKKKPPAVSSRKGTAPIQFRLRPETLADLDAVAAHLASVNGGEANRADAVRYALRLASRKIRSAQAASKISDKSC